MGCGVSWMPPLWVGFLIAGIAGAFVRAWRDYDQTTRSRETVTDCVVGGASSILAPPLLTYFFPAIMAALAATQYQVLIVFLTGFGASFAWVLLVRQRVPALLNKAADKVSG